MGWEWWESESLPKGKYDELWLYRPLKSIQIIQIIHFPRVKACIFCCTPVKSPVCAELSKLCSSLLENHTFHGVSHGFVLHGMCPKMGVYTPNLSPFHRERVFLNHQKIGAGTKQGWKPKLLPAPGTWLNLYLSWKKACLFFFRLSIGFFGGFPCFETTPLVFSIENLGARSDRGQLSTFPTSSNFSRIACSALASASASGRRRRLDGWASKSWIWPWKKLDSSQAEMIVFYYETLSQDGI